MLIKLVYDSKYVVTRPNKELNNGGLNPCGFNFAIIRSSGGESKAFGGSIRRALNVFPLSTDFLYYSVMS